MVCSNQNFACCFLFSSKELLRVVKFLKLSIVSHISEIPWFSIAEQEETFGIQLLLLAGNKWIAFLYSLMASFALLILVPSALLMKMPY